VNLLLDSSMWGPTAVALREAGHDVDWVGDWPADPGDRAILERAHAEGRVLVTLDNDFGELAVRQHVAHSGIIRVALTPVWLEAAVCLTAIAAYGSELVAGAIVTATPRRMRLRRAGQAEDDG
jgi:predicted nuclease of predicted toxin-antitoxin system